MDCSPPGSSVHGIFQARVLEWGAIAFSGINGTRGEILEKTIQLEAGSQRQVEKAMAPHSSTLAWKIPWAEEPGGLQSMGSRGVGHN